VKVTFGMIVLNGEPFVRYNLRALYPFAHEIVVVEGACAAAAEMAMPSGHSSDGTLKAVRKFQAEEDPAGKVRLVTAEDDGAKNGFWVEKDEMSQAFARRATGDYLWQVDSDEFYLPGDMSRVLARLQREPEIREVRFRVRTFWGRPDVLVDSRELRGEEGEFRRLFAWGPGFQYVKHRPPTVADGDGKLPEYDRVLRGDDLASEGIFLYHYELLFPKQVLEKCRYYSRVPWSEVHRDSEMWAADCYMTLGKPYRVHMLDRHRSWLEEYQGDRPPEVDRMYEAVERGLHPGVKVRAMEDAARLLKSRRYAAGRYLLKVSVAPRRRFERALRQGRSFLRDSPLGPLGRRLRRALARRSSSGQERRYLSRGDVTPDLERAWASDAIPSAQRRLVDIQLQETREGSPPAHFQAFAEAVRATGLADGRLLEVGCASGYYEEVLRLLVGNRFSYTGLDYSMALLWLGRHEYPAVAFSGGDAKQLPFGDAAFDVVVSGGVILHVPDYEAAISEAARVARSWVVFHRTPVWKGATRFFTKNAYGVECVEVEFGEKELVRLFEEASLKLVRVIEISPGLLTYVCRKTDRSREGPAK
jgi:SAM-dependent methyltransferase